MKPRTKVLLLAAIIIAGLAFVCLRKSEPSYQGKSLNEWLRLGGVVEDDFAPNKLSDEQTVALLKMGTNTIPYLVKQIGRKNSAFENELAAFIDKLGLNTHIDFDNNFKENLRAANAFQAFGAEARDAIPSLAALLKDQETAFPAAYALVNIGAEAMPALTNALLSTNLEIAGVVTMSLQQAGTNGVQAIPALLVNLTNGASFMRMAS